MISIVGCGWLGTHIATFLQQNGVRVFGTTTRQEQLGILNDLGITTSLLTVSDKGDVLVDSDDVFLSPILIITLPFRRRFLEPTIYLDQIKGLVNRYCDLNSENKWIIFTSSTSVYSLTNSFVSEDDEIIITSERQRVLYDVERYLLALMDVDVTILRCAGLYGYDRRIAHFLSGKQVANKDAYVNLIHVDDVVGITNTVINQGIKNTTINCVANHHPTKEELYSFHTQKHALPSPVFMDDVGQSNYKIVSNDKVVKDFQYCFKYTNLFTDYD